MDSVLSAPPRPGLLRRETGAQALLPYARHTLRLHQLYATVGADNLPSLKLFEAAGFRQVGVRQGWLRGPAAGQWHDAVEWQYVFGNVE